MFSNIGIPGLILIFVIALIIFTLPSCRKSGVPPDGHCWNLKAPQNHLCLVMKKKRNQLS